MNNHLKTGLTILSAALVMAGCADMGGITTHATVSNGSNLASSQSLAGARLSPAAWPQADWWTRYGDPQLNQLMKEALSDSPTLRAAEARVRKAMAAVTSTGAALKPQVSGAANATYERFPEHATVPPPLAGTWDTQANLQATLNYDLDLWGKNRAAYDAAVGAARAAEVDAATARLTLSVNIADAYVQMQRAYLQMDVAEKTLGERDHLYKLTVQRFDAGLDSRLAVKQAEAALPASREQIEQLKESIALSRNQIAALMGQGPDRGLAIQRPAAHALPEVTLPANLPASLLGRRPEIVAQRYRVEAAGKGIAVAKAAFYPDVSLTAFVGLQSIGLPGFISAASRTLGAGPAVTLPIFDGGRLRGNLAGASADYDFAVEAYNQALALGLRDVVDQITSLNSLGEQRKQQRLAQATAQEAYDLALLRYREGVGNYLEVLNAESQLLTQESLDVDLQARALTLSINLTRALGGGFDDKAVAETHAQAQAAQAAKATQVAAAQAVNADSPPHKSWLTRWLGH